MTYILMTKTWILLIALAPLFLASCGKEFKKDQETQNIRAPRNTTVVDPDVQSFFRSQTAGCLGDCHPSVAKLVVYERGRVRYCTGTLVEQDLLATSSNCLSRNLQLPNISCVNSVFAVFPKMKGLEEAKVNCERVVSSTSLDQDQDPALWRNDFAFIRLKEPAGREPVDISREGLPEDENLVVWKMDYLDDRRASLESDKCKPTYDTYANPFSQKRFSPMVAVADCEFSEGNLGAPLFNERGEMVGLLSSKMDKGISAYVRNNDILSESLASLHHASNFACADIPLEEEAGYRPENECFKEIGYARLDRHRSRMLNSRVTHQENMLAIEEELERADKYFMWDVKFFSDKRGSLLEAHFGMPKCFLGANNWINEFSTGWWRRSVYTYGSIEVAHPRYLLKTKLNRLLRPVSHLEKGEMKTYKVEFNPAEAYFSKNTYVTITADLLGSPSRETYLNITDQCF